MASVILGQGFALSIAAVEEGSMMVMDGLSAHAMDHQDSAETCKDCVEMDSAKECSNCTVTACSATLFHETPGVDAGKVILTNAPGIPPALTGIERQYLPLPPP